MPKAKAKCATEILEKLGWEKTESESKETVIEAQAVNDLNKPESSMSLKPIDLDDTVSSSVQLELKKLCSEKNLTFRFHDCRRLAKDRPMFNACVTVDGVTVARRGIEMQRAKDKAAADMIDHLNGKPVYVIQSDGFMDNKSIELSHPSNRLQELYDLFCHLLLIIVNHF